MNLRQMLDRRSVIVAGAALLGTAALPRTARRRRRGPCARGRSARQGARVPVRPRAGAAQGRLVCLERLGVARLELFRRDRLHQTGPSTRADERARRRKRRGACSARCGRPRASPRRRTSCCCRTSWRRAATAPASVRRSASRLSVFGTPAETGAWGFRCEGHHLTQSVAVRDNRIVSVTPTSFSAIPNRVQIRAAHRPQHAQGRRGSGAAADGRSVAEAAGQGADRRTRRPTTFCPTPAANAPTPRRSGSRPRRCRRRSATCCGR